MVSADKLIKVGVKYSDQYFEELKQIYIRAYSNSMSFEEFLDETSDYSIGNPMDAGGFNEQLTNIVASSINDIRFSRPAQKALMNNIIRQTTGELITNVGEDIKASVRDIVKRGYNTGTLSRQNVAKEIESTLDGINHKRARTIARTEIKRAQTTSNYIVAKERGANAYKYKCGATPCKICKVDCGETFPIDDLEHLPPRHPNCMCGVTFFKDPNMKAAEPNTDNVEETIESTDFGGKQLSAPELKKLLSDEEYDNFQKYSNDLKKYTTKLNKLQSDDPRRIMYERRIESTQRRLDTLENIGINPENRKVTSERVINSGKYSNLKYNEITTHEQMADHFGLKYIEETTSQYGKSVKSHYFEDVKNNLRISGLDKFDISETKEVLRVYDKMNPILKKSTSTIYLDPTTKTKDLGLYNPASNSIEIFSHNRDTGVANFEYTLNHEMTHALDKLLYDDINKFFSQASKEYRKIVRDEGWGSAYSYNVKGSTRICEDFAETGSMVLNRNNPNVKITLQDGKVVTAREWCEMFPKKTKYFEKVLQSEKAQQLLR